MKYYIKYQSEKFYLTDEEYTKLNDALYQKGMHINFRGMLLKKSQVEVLPATDLNKQDDENDLSNPAYKEEIKQFEKEFLKWKTENPTENKVKNIFAHIRWFESLGVIETKWDEFTPDITMILKNDLYTKLSKKWSDLQSLHSFREKAQGYQNQSMNQNVLKSMEKENE